MTPKSQGLEDTLDTWLVHDESCPTSWSGIGFDKCDCIAKDQKRNLTKDISALLEKAELKGRLDELERNDYLFNKNLGSQHALRDRKAELKAALTAKDKTTPRPNRVNDSEERLS